MKNPLIAHGARNILMYASVYSEMTGVTCSGVNRIRVASLAGAGPAREPGEQGPAAVCARAGPGPLLMVAT